MDIDDFYASILNEEPGPSGVNLSDSEDNISECCQEVSSETPSKPVSQVLDELAVNIKNDGITKLNVARNFIWEGTKRALTHKSFIPSHRISVKFTDDSGQSEGAVDWGGPMREFFTLVMQHIHDSNLLCGPENQKVLSFDVKRLEENDYFVAGRIVAMSLVHGGPSPHFLSPLMYQALTTNIPLNVQIDDVYDEELKSSLKALSDATTVNEAKRCAFEGTLSTVLDLAGTLAMPMNTLDDVQKVVLSTAQWFVLGRCKPALESFRDGLSCLGVLDAVKKYPNEFKPLFCDQPVKLTAESLERLFKVKASPVGSSKALTESLVLSRWSDYLQEIEEDEESTITLVDVLFFSTGCKEIPQRTVTIYPAIDFLHDEESKFPKANTCACVLRLPVVHTSYESFKADVTFGILNGKGFGTA